MTKKKLKIVGVKDTHTESNDPAVPSLEYRLQSTFTNDKIKVLLITDRIYDPTTFEASQGIKLDVNGVEVKMKWNVEAASQHQSATGISSEDIIYNAVVGTLTAWGTCRM